MRCLIIAPIAIASIVLSISAHADVSIPAIQFICTPRINYFSATTVNLDNVDVKELQRSAALTIMNLADLNAHPYMCRWGGNTIRARLTFYHEAQPTGFCGAVDYGTVEIDWNGASLGKIEQDHCRGDRHTVVVTDLHYHGPASIFGGLERTESEPKLWIEHCSSSEDRDGKFTCDIHYFDAGKGRLR